MRHPRNCRAIEADAAAAVTHAALKACLHMGTLMAAQPAAGLNEQTWSAIADHTIVPITKFPASPTLRASFREVFLACTKPLAQPNPPESAWKLFALLPWLLLQRPAARKGPAVAVVLHKRIQHALAGRWAQLVHDATQNEQIWSNYFAQPRGHSQDPEHRRMTRVQALASQGDVSKAANLLASNAIILSPHDPDVAAKLAPLLVTTPYTPVAQPQVSSTTASDSPQPQQLAISPTEAAAAIRHSGPSAAGPTGWHVSAIKCLAHGQASLDRLASILTSILVGQLPGPLLQLLSSGALTVLSKDKGGVRPIVTRSIWLRLLSKSIVLKEQRTLARALAPLQCGVGMQGGTEFVTHSLRQLCHQHPDWVVTSLDMSNAYGTVSRAHIREQLMLLRQEDRSFALAYFDRFCAPPFLVRATDYSTTVAEGVVQGDPLSPLFFALALQSTLTAASATMLQHEPSARIFAYLDDVYYIAPASVVVPTFEVFQTSIVASQLRINAAKTQVYKQNGPHALDDIQSHIGGDICTSLRVLGSVMSCDTIAVPQHTPTDAQDVRLFNRLDSLPSLQLRLTLLRMSVVKQYVHQLRTTPPSLAAPLAANIDNLVRKSLHALLFLDQESLKEETYKEACLPTSLGGLGITCLQGTQPLAYLSSMLAALQQWRRYEPDTSALIQHWSASPELQQALAAVQPLVLVATSILKSPVNIPTSGQQALSFIHTQKLQKKLQSFHDLSVVNSLKTTHLLTSADRAQYLSKTARGASAFLLALPTDRSLSLSNETMLLSLRMWMRLPLLPALGAPSGLPCSCKSTTVLEENHILNCNVDAARDIRHNVIAYCLQDMLQSTQQNPVALEPRATTTGSDLHRFDLSVAGFDSTASNLKLDVTIRNPIATHIVDRAACSRLAAATDGVNEKLAKYKHFLSSQDIFWPIAIETFGGLHGNVFKLVSSCAKRVANLPPDSCSFTAPTFSAYWLQRLSCTLWKENCRLASTVVEQALKLVGSAPHELVSDLALV
jgi:hypothetical protein